MLTNFTVYTLSLEVEEAKSKTRLETTSQEEMSIKTWQQYCQSQDSDIFFCKQMLFLCTVP